MHREKKIEGFCKHIAICCQVRRCVFLRGIQSVAKAECLFCMNEDLCGFVSVVV